MIVDEDSFEAWDTDIAFRNPIDFPDYEDKVQKMKDKLEMDEAVITGRGKINGHEVVIGVMDSRFIMGSMSSVVGEKLHVLLRKL